MADFDVPEVDRQTHNDIRNVVSDAGRESSSQLAGDYGKGMSYGRGLLTDNGQFDKGLGMQNPMSDAIKAKYGQQYARAENGLSLRLRQYGEDDHLKKLEVATNLANQEVEQNRQAALMKWQMKQQKKAQRGQVLGTVLGIAGAVAGGAMTAGAGTGAGAAAGYAIGSGIGGYAGSQ